ncbi:MAG TPA: ABC transporter permease [Terriglobales bacterium]
MNGFLQDVRYALRQLRKSPGFSLAVVLTLALGIGVNSAVFSLLDGFLLRPLPYPHPEQLGVLMLHRQGVMPETGKAANEEDDSQDGDTWDWVRDNVPAVREASYGMVSGVNLQAGSVADSGALYVQEMRVSAHYFDVLGLPFYLGREFTEEEDRHGGPPVTILSYTLWQTTFHADRQIIGNVIHLKGEPYTVVGVLPPHAQTTQIADVWTPLQPAPMGECGGSNCGIILRLVPGATWQQAATQISNLRKPYFVELANKYKGRAWFYPAPMSRNTGYSNDERTPVMVLMLAVSFILLIACANLAGLTLVRITRRASEIATRLALGATRWTILRQLWSESLLLALFGASTGLALAMAILKFLTGFLPADLIPLGGLSVDWRVLAFTFVASVVASLFFGALPAMQTRRVDLRSSIAIGAQAGSRGASRLRQGLIAGEVALTVVLLAGAGLLIRTLIYLENTPPGFDATNVMTAKLSLDDARYHDASAFHNLLDYSLAVMHQIPGVENAAVGLSVPYERGLNDGVKLIDGKIRVADPGTGSSATYVTPGYFATLRIPILLGREFAKSDTETSESVAVVNEKFVREFFTESNPIGRHIRTEGKTYTIVGIGGDVAKRPGLQAAEPLSTEPVFYVPATQMGQGSVNMAHVWFQPSWIVRTGKPIEGIKGAMQKALTSVDPSLPFSGFYSMHDILEENLTMQRVQVLLLGVLAGLALLLSVVGIYGLVSNLIAQRRREIGIRMALGAQIRQVMAEVGRAGVVASMVGLVGGLIIAFFAVRVLQGNLYGVQPNDPLTMMLVSFVLLLIALVASFLPTLRIAKIDPSQSLRME